VPDDASTDPTLRTEAASESEETRPSSRGAARTGPLRQHVRYEVERELARGGLGRVLIARDRRLNRTVALKELLDGDSESRERFEREVRITARLHHPSIVSLFDVGAWPGGEPFYAMELVSGRALESLIRGATTLDERLAFLPNVLAVSEAVAYAHGVGVIHRDLKPANILIGEFGETQVIDWGLARDGRAVADERSTPSAGGSGDATIAGTVLGTPSYMPPEQARGEPVDERADVYALGAILYHVLAGAPPFQRATAAETLAAVEAGPPEALAARQHGIARDLLTIVDKAMARDPRQRYATAAEFAEDLRRFTTGQLVRSHVYSFTTILRRFMRRNRAAVLVAVVMLAVLAVVGALGVRHIIRQRDVADRQRRAGEELVRYTLTELREQIERRGSIEQLRAVGAEVEKYYQAILSSDPLLDDATAMQRSAGLEVLAFVRFEQGNAAEALALYRASLALRQRLARLQTDATDWAEGLLTCHSWIGELLRIQGDLLGAWASQSEGLRAAEQLAARRPDEPTWQSWQGHFHGQMADIEHDQGNIDGSVASYRAALAIACAVAERDPGNARWQKELGISYSRLAYELRAAGELRAALAAGRAARDIAAQLAHADPGNQAAQFFLGRRQQELCKTLTRLDEIDEALAACRAGRDTLARLVAIEPANTEWLATRNNVEEQLARVLEIAGDLQAALAGYEQALATSELLAQTERSSVSAAINVAVTHMDVGHVQRTLGELEGARAAFRAARTVLRGLLVERPHARGNWLGRLGSVGSWLGDIEADAGHPEAATIEYEQAAALLATAPRIVTNAGDLAHAHAGIARSLLARGASNDALTEARRALAVDEELVGQAPTSPTAAAGLAERLAALAEVFTARSDWAGAIGFYDSALAIRAQQAAAAPKDRAAQGDLAAVHIGLGAAALGAGDAGAALVEDRAALAILEPLAARSPDSTWPDDLARARVQIAAALARSHGGAAEARLQLEQAHSILAERRAKGRLTVGTRALLAECERRLKR
jgi:tetratricopeptide (TPR) repeat protein